MDLRGRVREELTKGGEGAPTTDCRAGPPAAGAATAAPRDESGRDRSEKYSNQFRFHILIRKRKRVRESSVGKTKSVMRDIEIGTIGSEACR